MKKTDRGKINAPLLILMEASLFIRLNEDSLVISGCPMLLILARSGDDFGEDDVMMSEAPLSLYLLLFHTL